MYFLALQVWVEYLHKKHIYVIFFLSQIKFNFTRWPIFVIKVLVYHLYQSARNTFATVFHQTFPIVYKCVFISFSRTGYSDLSTNLLLIVWNSYITETSSKNHSVIVVDTNILASKATRTRYCNNNDRRDWHFQGIIVRNRTYLIIIIILS